MLAFLSLILAAATRLRVAYASPRPPSTCRSQPGDPTFPTTDQLAQFNSSIEGRLIHVVPTGQFCKDLPGGCTDAQWTSGVFLSDIPGSMLENNWEQDYASNPPSLCFRNSDVCGQGYVPIYGVNATTTAHIQAGVRFAQEYNLKVAIKSSGHDYLGRSGAKRSLLLWTHHIQDIIFHDSFSVGGKDQGSAVTVGSGVGLRTLYREAKAKGKIFVGGTAQTVAAAGGYVQGAGHSALSPTFGLAADNALEFQIVIANGILVTANEVSHAPLFWALRGGGAGSWGVLISATFRTFPTFNAAHHLSLIVANSSAQAAQLATLHARHIFDYDDLKAGQYFYLSAAGSPPTYTFKIDTIVPYVSLEATNAALAPFVNAVTAAGFNVTTSSNIWNINDMLSVTTDTGGTSLIIGSRLVPADVYRNNPESVGEAYKKLLDANIPMVLGHLVAGGQVADNAGKKLPYTPEWGRAKTHMIAQTGWPESTPAEEVEAIRQDFTKTKVPILKHLAGENSGAYSNEADIHEPQWQTTFFGPNYAKLLSIKKIYDPNDLFIVAQGVGSERWDRDGLCRV